jgi:hypothetical protein
LRVAQAKIRAAGSLRHDIQKQAWPAVHLDHLGQRLRAAHAIKRVQRAGLEIVVAGDRVHWQRELAERIADAPVLFGRSVVGVVAR